MSVSAKSKTNFSSKISTTRKIHNFAYSLTRSFFTMNIDYHHQYPSYMKSILWYQSILVDPFFWVINYNDVYLFVFIGGVWGLLIFFGYGGYCYFQSGIHERYYLFLSVWNKLLGTILLIPMAAIFFKSLRCHFFDGSFIVFEFTAEDNGHRCTENPFLPVMVVALICIFVLTVVAMAGAVVVPDRLFSMNAFGATPTGRWHAFIILMTSLIYMTKIFYSSHYFYVRMMTPVLSILLNLILFLAIMIQFPYYWKITNVLVGSTFAASIGGQFTGLLSEILSDVDTSEVFDDIFFASFLALFVVVCVIIGLVFLSFRYLLFLWGLLIFKKSRKVVLTKYFLRIIGKEQFDLFLPYCTTKELESLDREIEDIYPRSVKAKVFLIFQCFEKKSFDPVRLKSIVRKLMQSQSAQRSVFFDLSFFLFNISERVVEMDFGNSENKKHLVKQISRASKYERVVRRILRNVFGSYLSESIRVNTLSCLFTELEENDRACYQVYNRVLKKNSDSPLVLRRYGKYLLQVRLEPIKADGFLRQAQKLDNIVPGDYGSNADEEDYRPETGISSSYSDHSSSALSDDGRLSTNSSQGRSSRRRLSNNDPLHRIRGESDSRLSQTSSIERRNNQQRRSSSSSRYDESVISGLSSDLSSLPVPRHNNYLDVDRRSEGERSHESFGKSSGVSLGSVKQKKRLSTRISRENIISVGCLYCCLFILFTASIITIIAIFSLSVSINRSVEFAKNQIFLVDDMSQCAVSVAIEVSHVSSTSDPVKANEHREEVRHHCQMMNYFANEIYSTTNHRELFRKQYPFKVIGQAQYLPLIDGIGSWRKYCELFLRVENPHLLDRNDSSMMYLFDNAVSTANVLRDLTEEFIDETQSDVQGTLLAVWLLMIIPLVVYPMIIPIILYFCFYQRSLIKLLLIIPKNAVFDTYKRFGGSSTDNVESKMFQSQTRFDTITKFCCYIMMTFALCYVFIIAIGIASQLSVVEFVTYLKKESIATEYNEKMKIMYFYLTDFKNPHFPYFNRNLSASYAMHYMDIFDENHRVMRFGNDEISGADESEELNELYYESSCEEVKIGAEINLENLKCYTFNQLIDVYRQSLNLFLDTTASPLDRGYAWAVIDLFQHETTLFNETVQKIKDILSEEFDEFENPLFSLIVCSFVSSLMIVTFVYCALLFAFPLRIKRHLGRIRRAFLYVDTRHLAENKLYRVLTVPPAILPWLSFSAVKTGLVSMREKQTRALLEELPSYAVVVFDRNRRIIFLNHEALNMMGLSDKKIAYGLKISNFFVDSSRLRAWMRSGESNTFTDEMEMNSIVLDDNDMEGEDGNGLGDNIFGKDRSLSSEELQDRRVSRVQRRIEEIVGQRAEFPSSDVGKKFNIFHARMSVVRKQGRYLAILKNIQAEIHQKQLVEHEKKRSEDYLYNILPKKIAKSFFSEGVEKHNLFVVHQEVTVVFQDMVGFTFYSSHTQPELIIAILNELFKGVDDLCTKHNMEKIKTIGDAYLAACGVPEYVHDHVKNSFLFARECLQFLFQFNFQKERDFHIRSGIHTGKVVAGVIGKIKYQYDIWGDAVNTAARMEQNGIPDKIQVSRETYAYLYKDYEFQERDVFMKGKGNQKVYVHTVENTFEEDNLEQLERRDLDEEGEGEDEEEIQIGGSGSRTTTTIPVGSDVDDILGKVDNNDKRVEEPTSNTFTDSPNTPNTPIRGPIHVTSSEVLDDTSLRAREEELRRIYEKRRREKFAKKNSSLVEVNISGEERKLKVIPKKKSRRYEESGEKTKIEESPSSQQEELQKEIEEQEKLRKSLEKELEKKQRERLEKERERVRKLKLEIMKQKEEEKRSKVVLEGESEETKGFTLNLGEKKKSVVGLTLTSETPSTPDSFGTMKKAMVDIMDGSSDNDSSVDDDEDNED